MGFLACAMGERVWSVNELWINIYEYLGVDEMAKKIGNPFRWIDKKMAQAVIFLIRIYQKTFSPDHGALKDQNMFVGCRFYPSCSCYSVQAFAKYGFVVGLFKTIWRVLRCNPWNKGGIDELK